MDDPLINTLNPRIGFIGAGVLGTGLALALTQQDYHVNAAYSRSPASAKAMCEKIPGCQVFASAQELADATDLVFITTPDEVIGSIAASVGWRPGQGVVHCCGAAGTDILKTAKALKAVTGAFHPFQTFAGLTDPSKTVGRLAGVTFAVSAEGWLCEFLNEMARRLGGNPVSIRDAERPLYHASAVLSCGYLAALLQGAVELWRTMGFSQEQAVGALLSLSRATLGNIEEVGLPNCVTGPVIRGDAETIASHLESIVRAKPDLTRVYLALTEASLSLAAEAGIGPEKEGAIRQLLRQYDHQNIPSQ